MVQLLYAAFFFGKVSKQANETDYISLFILDLSATGFTKKHLAVFSPIAHFVGLGFDTFAGAIAYFPLLLIISRVGVQ